MGIFSNSREEVLAGFRAMNDQERAEYMANKHGRALNTIIGACGVLLSLGIALFFHFYGAGDPVNRSTLTYASLKYSLPALAVFIVICAPLLKARKGWDRRWRALLPLSAGVFLLYGAGAVRFYNCYMDRSAPVKYETEVHHKYYQCRGHFWRSCSYYLDLNDWHGPYWYSLEVPEEEYNWARTGQKYAVVTRSGALGHEWLLDYYALGNKI